MLDRRQLMTLLELGKEDKDPLVWGKILSDFLQDGGEDLGQVALRYIRQRNLWDEFLKELPAHVGLGLQNGLPPRWVYVAYRLRQDEKERHDWNSYRHWVIFGTPKAATKRWSEVWQQIQAFDLKEIGRKVELDSESDYFSENPCFYPNNYKVDTRALIAAGRYTA